MQSAADDQAAQAGDGSEKGYSFVEELEAAVNEVKGAGVPDRLVARLSRVFADTSSRLSHAALLGQALLEERESLREKLREISGEAEKRLCATFDENQRLKTERDDLYESCTRLEKTCSLLERDKHHAEQRLMAIVEQFREEEEKWRNSRPQARKPDSRVQELLNEMDAANIQHAKEIETLKSENASLRADNVKLLRQSSSASPPPVDSAEVEQLRAEAQRAGRLDAKLKESLKTVERLQKEAAEIEEERLKLEAVVDPLMKANRAFQNEQAAQAALIEDLRKELALAKQQLADKDVALLSAANSQSSPNLEIRNPRRKPSSGSYVRPRSSVNPGAFTGLVDQLRSNTSSSSSVASVPSIAVLAPTDASSSPRTTTASSSPSAAAATASTTVDTATWLMLTSLEKELEQVATIASSLQQPSEAAPPITPRSHPPPASPRSKFAPSTPAPVVPPLMLSPSSPRVDELEALRPPVTRVQFEYTKLDKIADRSPIISEAQVQALGDAEKDFILHQLTMLRSQFVEERKREEEFLERVVRLRGKLRDANLTRMNQTMRSILSFRELIDVSNIYLDCVLRESTRLQTTLSVPIFHVILELLIEISVLQKRNNDYSEGINAPLLDKLDQFERDWRQNPAAPPPRASPPPAEKPGFFSMLSNKIFSPAKSESKRRDSTSGEPPKTP